MANLLFGARVSMLLPQIRTIIARATRNTGVPTRQRRRPEKHMASRKVDET
jgi:hypothetical protein